MCTHIHMWRWVWTHDSGCVPTYTFRDETKILSFGFVTFTCRIYVSFSFSQNVVPLLFTPPLPQIPISHQISRQRMLFFTCIYIYLLEPQKYSVMVYRSIKWVYTLQLAVGYMGDNVHCNI